MASAHQTDSPECKFGTFVVHRAITPSKKPSFPPLRISYRIIRPSLLKPSPSEKDPTAPLLVIHGGPSLPSEYLTPLASHLQNRAIIFYDQLGCGWSSIPQQDNMYSVFQMALDLEELVSHLKIKMQLGAFHLMGHSLGGAIGYEFLKRRGTDGREGRDGLDVPQCLSLILSNASTNFDLSNAEQECLFQEFQLQQMQTTKIPKKMSIEDQFFHAHVCRTDAKPSELELAFNKRGKQWSAKGYNAEPVEQSSTYPPGLIIRGQHDFVSERCTRGWKDILNSELEEVVLEDCAHYPHFEQPEKYSALIEYFCSKYDS